MNWYDPFTGWRNGWIGRRAFTAWIAIFIGVGAAAWAVAVFSPLRDVPVTRAGRAAIWIGILVFYGLPQYNLMARRFRDIGLNGWWSTILLVVADRIAERFLDYSYLLLIGAGVLCITPPDKYGSRVDRGPRIDPDVFS